MLGAQPGKGFREMDTSKGMRLGPGVRLAAAAVLVVALVLLFWGLTLPILSLTRFWVFGDTVSIVSAIKSLYGAGEVFLASVLLVFSILFPVGKNLAMLAVFVKGARIGRFSRRLMHGAAVLGKWSMLDVFIVAILVASVKLGLLAHASVMSALYFFAASVILTNLLTTSLDWWLRHGRDRDS